MVSGWKTVSLHEIGSWHGGLTPSMSNPLFWGGSIYWLSSGDVKRELLNNSTKQITELALSKTSLKCLPKGTIVIVVRSGILRVNLPVAELQTEMTINQDLKGIVVHDSISSRFILHTLIFHREQILKTCLKSGTTVESIELKWLKEFEIQLPPLPEQHAIAEALSDVDSYIASLEKLIAKKNAIKQAAMQELLIGKRRLPGFVGEWVKKPLGELFDFFGGFPASRAQLSTIGYPYLHYGDIHGTNQTYVDVCSDVSIPRLNTSLTKLSPTALLQNGDVVFVDASEDDEGVSRHVVVRNIKGKPFISGLHTIIARAKTNELDNLFKEFCFQTESVKSQFKFYAVGTKVTGVNKTSIAKVNLYYPISKEEQLAIAAILSDMDGEIEALITKLDKAQLIRKGMMQELLIGRIRLAQPEADNLINVKSEIQFASTSFTQKNHNQQFDDAVMISGIVNAFYTDKYPLGRKKVQKLLYLLRRKQDENTAAFKKKAAGPYADEVRYIGGEPIAKSNHYIATTTTKGKGTIFTQGKNIGQALNYIERWDRQSDIQWLADKFRYTSVDDLELLATVDMAICDLKEAGIPVSVASIKHLIATNTEWQAKLQKKSFADSKIAKAINDLQTLL